MSRSFGGSPTRLLGRPFGSRRSVPTYLDSTTRHWHSIRQRGCSTVLGLKISLVRNESCHRGLLGWLVFFLLRRVGTASSSSLPPVPRKRKGRLHDHRLRLRHRNRLLEARGAGMMIIINRLHDRFRLHRRRNVWPPRKN